ncbi:polycystic kidney disease and receptor for egg jelly-related protein-like [Homalodisca vitripennis]|uniref:polycystic kidney disease and receptor for egg jelly-related protein-like n=1 Tax=Homalodisca vitripennis TaxID=197043 RepID=UPI001EEAE93B|nr:polycystic kidney disease and receptor for egg jelly-related protein-like [Homalodisca vitripennis]
MTELDLELSLKIHRIDCPSRSLMIIKFIFPQSNSSLRVYALANFRPDYEMVTTEYVNITENSPVYPFMYNKEKQPSFLFVGILPGVDIPINQSVPYSFEMSSVLCQYWDKGQWSSRGCNVNPSTKDKDVHCQCKHLSMFAAAFLVPPQEIDPFTDAKLFLTVIDNPMVAAFIASILLLYLILIFFLWRLDRKDKKQRTVVVLEDNFPGSHYPYLIAVYTSSRLNSGTTAHVGFRINGSLAMSRVHIFSARDREVLKRNTDDWFLIYCDQYLGTMESIIIWHDNYGSSPEWFCDRIHVFDLKGNVEAIFIVEQWLSFSLKDYPEAYVRVASEDEVLDVKLLFVDNLFLGLREIHVLFSVFLRHPRSEIGRIQRISVLLAFLIGAMLWSIMFYIPENENTQLDDYQYQFGTRECFISIQSLIISGIIVFIIMFSFRRSYTIIYDIRYKPSLYVRSYTGFYYDIKVKKSTLLSVQTCKEEGTTEEKHNKSVYRNFIRLVVETTRTPPLSPIQLPPFYIVIKKRKIWFTLAWTLCIAVIFVSAYFVMLYGLKLGPVKSEKWLSTVLASLGADAFVSSPTKIIFFAIILTLVFQRMYEVNTHAVTYKEAMRVVLENNEESLAKVLAIRKHPMYSPLTQAKRHEMFRKKELMKDWFALIDFVITTFFVIVVCTIISKLWSSLYRTNNQLHTVMTSSHHINLGGVNFYSISNITQMEMYLEHTFMYAAYNTRWYNDVKFVKKNEEINTKQDLKTGAYWLSDFTGIVLGLPLLRQLRVYTIPCGNQVNQKANCTPKLSNSHKDTDVYGVGWKSALYSDVMKNNYPWKYIKKDSTLTFTLFRLYGKSGRLHERGGYAVTLGPTRHEADITLVELRRNNWQDKLTRVVILEITVYNINLDILSQVTLIVEYKITGNILLKGQVISVEHYVISNVWKIIYICLLVYYLYRCLSHINREGLLQYLSSVKNVLRLLIVLLGFISIAVYSIFYYTLKSYILSFEKQGMNSYFEFDTFMLYYVQLQIWLSVLLCIAIIRLLMLLRFGRPIITYYYTIIFSFKLIRWLVPVLMSYVITFYFLAFYLNLYTMLDLYKIIQKYHRVVFKPTEIAFHGKLFILFKIVSLGIFMSIFITIFIYDIKFVRRHKLKHSDDFNFINFLLSQLKKLLKRKKKTEFDFNRSFTLHTEI